MVEEKNKKRKKHEAENKLYKDKQELNRKSALRNSMKEIAELVERAGGVCNRKSRSVLIDELLNGAESQQEHIPNHDGCSGCKDDTVNEKRICRCMYYYMKKPETCKECKIKEKWNKVGAIEVIDYERPTKCVLKNVGGMDLIIKDGEQRYAVEVKPSDSDETLARMFAEILTYTIEMDEEVEEKNIKPAIGFFEGSEQMKQYMELKAENNVHLELIEKHVKVYYFKTKKNSVDSNVTDFELCEIKRYENGR